MQRMPYYSALYLVEGVYQLPSTTLTPLITIDRNQFKDMNMDPICIGIGNWLFNVSASAHNILGLYSLPFLVLEFSNS